MPLVCINSNPLTGWQALSLAAWRQTLLALPGKTDNFNNMPDFQIFQLPDSPKLAFQTNDDWVLVYEQAQERLARQERKKGQAQNGVFYTPPSIAEYLVGRTLGLFLEKHHQSVKQAISDQKITKAQVILDEVQSLKVIDPACGTGVFLVEALKRFADFYAKIRQQFPALKMLGNADYSFRHQLYGVDLDPLSVAITEFRLAQWVCWLDQKKWTDFEPLSGKQYLCADTLKANPFPERVWDFIFGNPPYVSEVRKQSKRFKPLQERGFYRAKMDLCDAFTAWAIEHLQWDGQLAYVLPEYWTQRASSAPLREMLWDEGQFQEIWAFGQTPVFKNAPGHHTALLIWQKRKMENQLTASQPIQWGQPDQTTHLLETTLSSALILNDQKSGKFLIGNQAEIELLKRLSDLPPLMYDYQIQQGIVLPQGRLKKTDWQKLPHDLQAQLAPDTGIFLLSETEVERLNLNNKELALLKPYYGPTGFLPFEGFSDSNAQYQLLYTDREARQRMMLESENYPGLKAHLDQFAPVLTSAFKPYGLHRARQKKWFEHKEKIFSPRQVMNPAFAVVPHTAYVSEGFYIILPDGDVAYWCALLNSQLAWYWFYHQKRKGHRLQIDKDVLLAFPQPLHQNAAQTKALIELSQTLAGELPEPERKALTARLNELVNHAYGITQAENQCILAADQAIFAPR